MPKLLYILFLMILSFSCKKKCKTITEVPREFLDYWYFDEGKYWVYALKDTSGILDTLTVTKTWTYDYTYDDHKKKEYVFAVCSRQYYIELKNSGTLLLGFYTPVNSIKLSGVAPVNSSWDYELGWEAESAGLVAKYPYQSGTQEGDLIDAKSITTPYQTFNDIKHFIIGNIYLTSDQSHIYFARNVGIVRIDKESGEIWELVETGM